jgi:hypothetical protein
VPGASPVRHTRLGMAGCLTATQLHMGHADHMRRPARP